MDFIQTVDKRYSVRKYKDTPVEREKLERIIKSGHGAPTAKNTNSVKVWAVTDKTVLENLKSASPCTFDAPLILVVGSDTDVEWVNERTGESRGMMDATIAADEMMLTAVSEGLGTCWVCLFDEQKTKAILGIGDNIKLHCCIIVGYEADDSEPNPRHFIRKPIEEFVTYVD